MHQIKIADWAIEQTLLRRGRLHVHENLDPRKTIVVDMQNGFCVEEVAAAFVPYAAEIVPPRCGAPGARCFGSSRPWTRRARSRGPNGSA